MESGPVTISVAELVGMLSLAADLGLGQPMEHLTRSCLIATRFGARIGLTGDDLATTYSLALLAWVGCMADSHETSARFGDHIDLLEPVEATLDNVAVGVDLRVEVWWAATA